MHRMARNVKQCKNEMNGWHAFDKWFIRSLSAIYERDKKRALFLPANKLNDVFNITCRTENPDTPPAGRVGAPGGTSGQGWAKLSANKNNRPGNTKSTVPSNASSKKIFNVFPETRTSEILCNPTDEQNLRLTIGLSAVDQQGEKRPSFLVDEQCNDVVLSL